MANTPDKVVSIALAEVGYLEKKNGNSLYDKTANAGSNNYTKYGKEMHNIYPAVMDYPAYWCDAFVDWCFYKAYGVSTAKSLLGGNFDDYTVQSAQLYKNKGAYIHRGKGTPKVGDQIFFRNSSRICHTGIVYAVDSTRVYTVEGNTSGASGVVANGGGVAKKSYLLTSTYIDGYGRPKYDTVKATTVSNPAVSIELNKTVKWTGIVTADPDLNVRKGAGKEYAQLTSYSSIKKGTKVGVLDDVKASDGSTWYYVVIDGSLGKKYGFVSSKYITKKSTSTNKSKTTTTVKAPSYTVGKVYTLQKRLQVYTGAGSSTTKKTHNQLTADGQKHDSTKSGKLDKNTQVTCKATKKLSNGNIWMQTPSGWMCAFNKSNGTINIK